MCSQTTTIDYLHTSGIGVIGVTLTVKQRVGGRPALQHPPRAAAASSTWRARDVRDGSARLGRRRRCSSECSERSPSFLLVLSLCSLFLSLSVSHPSLLSLRVFHSRPLCLLFIFFVYSVTPFSRRIPSAPSLSLFHNSTSSKEEGKKSPSFFVCRVSSSAFDIYMKKAKRR